MTNEKGKGLSSTGGSLFFLANTSTKLFDTLTELPFCLIAQKTRENKRIRDNPKKK